MNPGADNHDNIAPQQIKKLPCDHIFHKSCLRSWFQRQQTCPTCRTSILRLNNPVHHHQANPQQQPPANAQPGPAQAPNQAAPQPNGPASSSPPSPGYNQNPQQNSFRPFLFQQQSQQQPQQLQNLFTPDLLPSVNFNMSANAFPLPPFGTL